MGGEMSKGNYGRIGQDPNWENDYKEACKDDPEVKNFHDKVEVDLDRLINTVENGSTKSGLSLGLLREATSCLAEKDDRFKDLILKNKKDIWKERNLKELVDLYSEINAVNKKFYTQLHNCLGKMSGNQSLLQVALQCIAPASRPLDKAQYIKCKEKLLQFQMAENPFNEEFSNLLNSVQAQNNQILEKLKAHKGKLDRKFKIVRLGKKISYILFAMVGASFFIFSVLGAAITSPPLAVTIAATPSILYGPSAGWLLSRLTKYENKIRARREVINIMQKRSYRGLGELEHISTCVERLEGTIDLILRSIDFFCKDEDHQQVAAQDIRKEQQRFMDQIDNLKNAVHDIRKRQQSVKDQIDDLCNHVDRCIQEIQNNSTQVLLKNTRE